VLRALGAVNSCVPQLATPPQGCQGAFQLRVIASPYLASPPSSLADKIQVLERSEEMVLAAHRTPVRDGLVATTVETVRFERPAAIHFRLLRGPVPHVLERFELTEEGDATLLHYEGELGTDLWTVGRWWGGLVARRWEQAVRGSVAEITRIAELRAAPSPGGASVGNW
jgi:hypothetical protein